MAKVFVTYSCKDSEFVDRLIADLEDKTRLRLRFDRRILEDGSTFDNLFGELGTSDFLIAIITKDSVNSPWCKKELGIAVVKEVENPQFITIPLIPDYEKYEDMKKMMPIAISTMLQDKLFSRFDDKKYDEALLRLVESLTPDETSEILFSEIFDIENRNPFWRIRAENFTNAATFVNLFEDPEKTYDQMISSKPTFIEGGRGSGKTMLLKSARASFITSIHSVNSFNDPKIPYFGVYQRASRATYSLFEESDKTNSAESKIIFMDQLILRLGQSILSELKDCRKNQTPVIDDSIEETISKIISCSLRLPKETNTFDTTELSIRDQISQITDYVRNKIRKTVADYTVKALDQETLDFMCKKIIETIPELQNRYICFLIDEYENFNENQKMVLNTIVKFNEGTSYTFKIAGKKTAFNISQTLEDQPLQETHDYEKVDMDFDLSKPEQKKRFSNHATKICEKIMKEAQFKNCNIKEILEDRVEYFKINSKTLDGLSKEQIMNKIKSFYYSSKKPWEELTHDQLDYLYYHYGVSAEYRLLKNKPRSYSGFDDFVTFSSGNIRIFVELCGMAYIFAIRDNLDPKNGEKISFANQTKAIEQISDYHLWDIQDIPVVGRAVQKFVNDLGDILREKLMTHFYEPESSLLSISNPENLGLKITLPNCEKQHSLQEIIDICVMYSIFQEHGSKMGRRGKTGYGTSSYDYVLNRIYAQILKISPRPMSSYSIHCENFKGLLESDTQKNAKEDLINKLRKAARTKEIEPITDFFGEENV